MDRWVDVGIIVMALPGAASGMLWGFMPTIPTLAFPPSRQRFCRCAWPHGQLCAGDRFCPKRCSADHAGRIRLRPVLMTMIVGMIPGPRRSRGGKKNAPLGRAVIGGLSGATIFTLLFVSTVFACLRRNGPSDSSRFLLTSREGRAYTLRTETFGDGVPL